MVLKRFSSPVSLSRLFCVIIVLSSNHVIAQVSTNLFLKNEILRISNKLPELKNAHRTDLQGQLFQNLDNDSLALGIDLSASYKNGALSHYDNYEDKLHYLVSPYLRYQLNTNVKFDVRVNVENIKDGYVYGERIYWADEFRNHRGGFEIAKISYESEYVSIDFGRDYFMPGIYLYERLIYSSLNYPHDQVNIAFHNKYFEISTYYLSLNTLTEGGKTYLRHLNGHRLSFNLKYGYVALNDMMLYGGEKEPIDVMMFNPLLLLYPYRKNKKHMAANNIMSLELYLNYREYFVFTELLLDDYQADREVPSDLEPPEWGMNITLGKNNILPKFNWKINYTHVANRTFNAPDDNYEKFLYKNYPLGHWLGNNFWEVKTSFSYVESDDWITDVTFYYNESGDEALYGPFNKDYLDYSVEEGYNEKFPFGEIHKQSGFKLTTFFSVYHNLLINADLSYWFQNSRLKNNTNFSLGFAYRI